MTEWIRTRVPPPPEALSQRFSEILGDAVADSIASLPGSLIDSAANLLTHVGNDRSAATDLLVADALITYAMEAAAEYSLDVEAIAERAAYTLATVASRGAQV
ncbi:MAG: hypothetical protein ABI556_12665 [Gemmatimonadales bacterium]